jgi:hypothetical protein
MALTPRKLTVPSARVSNPLSYKQKPSFKPEPSSKKSHIQEKFHCRPVSVRLLLGLDFFV